MPVPAKEILLSTLKLELLMLSFSATMALVSAVIILLIGFRVYLLDRSNLQYRGFGALCGLLSWMCFCWYNMEQTDQLEVAIFWRRLQSVWTLSNPLIVYCCWRYASMYLRSIRPWFSVVFLGLIAIPGLIFFGLELFTLYGHGIVTRLPNGQWGLALNSFDGLTITRGIWSILIYGSSIYFIHLIWQEESIQFRKRWLGGLLVLLTFAASVTIYQNYVLPINGVVLPINESWNTLISVIFFGWALSDFQIFDLKPESTFEHVVGSMTNLMIITNADFRVKKINPIAMDFLGTNEKDSRNVTLESIICPEAAAKLKQTAKHERKLEIRLEIHGKQANILFTTSTIKDRRGREVGYVFVGNDLTDLYSVMSEVKQMNKKLASSNQSLERFAYAVSHDLKQPLRTINGFVKLLDKRISDLASTDIKEFMSHINQGVVRMNSLIDSILTLSRIGSDDAERERISMDRVILEVKDKLYGLCYQKKAHISYQDLPMVKGQYHQISLLFQNLIENGIKYNTHQVPTVSIACQPVPEGHQFVIQDNGIGIEPKYREQVFKLFKRLHPWGDYEGTGIGLTMCQKIVENLGGRIWIESPENGHTGTVFKFIIPEHAA